jgi:diaminopimelate decarboxylase
MQLPKAVCTLSSYTMITQEQLLTIAGQFGTPLYVYDADVITRQYQKLTQAFPGPRARFFYACKALTNINILRHIRSLGAGIDTVSIHEVMLGFKAGFNKEQILYTPNCVDFEEIEKAKELGIHINIDNISILEQFGNRYGNSYPVMIRLNPHIMAGGNFKISTGHVDSKFGVSIHQLRHIERIVRSTRLRVTGLHMHTGSEIKDTGVFLEGLDVMLNAARQFDALTCIDLGSGFKVPYQPSDPETNIQDLGARVLAVFDEYEAETGKNLEVWFEPGKYLVSESGFFVVKANVIKQTPATVFVGVNSGFNHLIRPMFYEAFHRIENISNPSGIERIYTVVGNLCETDTFGWDRKIAEVREGDLLVFYNAGAYGYEMASNFNSRLKPAEVLWKDNNAHLIRKRDSFDDLLRLQVDLEAS